MPASPPVQPATVAPIARVAVDVPLAHLDRPFDYLVPDTLDEQVVVGGRVRVRFAGKLVDGYVLDRVGHSDHTGKLAVIERAVSAESVLAPEIVELARELADRHAGTLVDVLRLAVPPRHAGAEKKTWSVPTVAALAEFGRAWSAYESGGEFLDGLRAGRALRAVWSALPGEDWPARFAEAAAAMNAAGRGAVLVVPDARDLSRLEAACDAVLGEGQYVSLSAALGPSERYRRWLAVRRGLVRCAIGTRAATFAPVPDLGLVAVWDDGDDLHAEPRAPYCHAREVLLVRAQQRGAAALVGGFARTPEAQLLVETGWARSLAAPRELLRHRAPRVTPIDADAQLASDAAAASARLPSVAWRAAREALAAGAPVLVQVPRRGYVPSLVCRHCRASARCGHCAGPLGLGGDGHQPGCRWCGRPAVDWSCVHCGARGLRAAVVGARRTAEELGRAFPETRVLTSGRDAVLSTVDDEPALVVATPGAEPWAPRGYGAVLLLDTWALLTRADLRAAQEALRRWLGAAALARAGADGGRVVITGDSALPVVQALVRWDPAGHAQRELAERAELGFPPAVRMAKVSGTPAGVADLLAAAMLPPGVDVLGPVPLVGDESKEQILLRVARAKGKALANALHAAAGVRSARKAPDPVRIEVDPQELV